ncbi:chromosomal replication initiator protein DnaA [Patescibacteria group bacterium]|nr:chromosomal replication initiator protein DnaA [Patescibacteria group bacterium]
MQTFDQVELSQIWKKTCQKLRQELSPAVYNTWIVANPASQIVMTNPDSAQVTISSPTAFHSTNLKKNLHPTLVVALESVLQAKVEVEYQVGQRLKPVLGDQAQSQNLEPKDLNQENYFASNHSPRESFSPGQSPRAEDLFSQQTIQSTREDRIRAKAQSIGLKTDYIFESFAVSTSNEMAHAAAVAVSNNPATSYNPLFFYGGVGVGKTHLMHAIAHNILKRDFDVKIVYCTGEEFTNEIVQAIQTKRASNFKLKYRSAQVLLIDDIQFIAGKNAVQEEFFHTFNALIKQNSQVVLTSDRPPQEISLLESRLRSRFEAGLMVDIQQPSFELRTAILLVKSQAANLPIPIELAKIVASRVESARKIEGIITSIRSEVELKGKQITPELIEKILSLETKRARPGITASPGQVIRAVANHFKLKQSALRGTRRVKHIVFARHIAMYILKEELSLPLAEIGRWFSDRDHTSILYATRKISQEIRVNDQMFQDVSALRTTLALVG